MNTDDHVYDINTMICVIHKTMTKPSVWLPPTPWYGLSTAGKTTLDNLTNLDKGSNISSLFNNTRLPQRSFTPRSNHQLQVPQSSHMSRLAQIHEQNPDDLVQFQADLHAFCVANHNNDTDHPPMEESNIVQGNNESLHSFYDTETT